MMNLVKDDAGLMTLQASGFLKSSDYERIVPDLEQALERGDRRILVDLEGFQGFTPAALVEELKFDIRHRKDFDRVAVIGNPLEDLGLRMLSPIFSGEIKAFAPGEREAAVTWLQED